MLHRHLRGVERRGLGGQQLSTSRKRLHGSKAVESRAAGGATAKDSGGQQVHQGTGVHGDIPQETDLTARSTSSQACPTVLEQLGGEPCRSWTGSAEVVIQGVFTEVASQRQGQVGLLGLKHVIISVCNCFIMNPSWSEGPRHRPGRCNAGGAFVFPPTFGYYLCTDIVLRILS